MHTYLEIVHAVRLGHRPGDRPPLDRGQPVPGCVCYRCTGVRPTSRRKGRPRDPLPVVEARVAPILEVATRLGLGEPTRRGKEWAVCCPFHDDHRPSLTLSEDGLWYCFPCGMGGDVIELYRRTTGCSFADAVRELAVVSGV